MESPRRGRNCSKRDIEDNSDVNFDRRGDDEEWEGSDKRKHRSSKSRKPANGDELDGLDGTVRRKSTCGDRNESRKRSGCDEDDYELRKELRSKQIKKKQEESSLEKLSSWYQDGELENRPGADRHVSKGHGRSDEALNRKKLTSKNSEHESSRSIELESSRTAVKSKEERSHDGEHERMLERDSRYSERRESTREKGHSSTEMGRHSRRKWDDTDVVKKAEEKYQENSDLKSGKTSESKYENTKERGAPARNESSESKSRGLDLGNEKGVKNSSREDRRVDTERIKSKNKSEALEEDIRGSPISRDERSVKEKNERHRQQSTPTIRDVGENHERPSKTNEDGNTVTREKNVRDVGVSNRSRTPEKFSKRHQELQNSEVEHERIAGLRRRDIEKDNHRDDWPKGRDDSWSERNRDREGSKENWKRRQPTSNDRESKDEVVYERGRDWEPRHGRERNDNERPHGRSRGEAVKTSSNFGISNDNYDVIEVPLDYGRTDSGSNFTRRTEAAHQLDGKAAANVEDWDYARDDRARRHDAYVSGSSVEDSKERYSDDGTSMREPSSWRDEMDYQGGKGRGQKRSMSTRGAGGQTSNIHAHGNQEPGSFGRTPPQGMKGTMVGRGRARPAGRDNQQVGVPLPIMGSPFGPLGMPPHGPLQPLAPSISPAPGPPMSPAVFIPPFTPPVVWPGSRGMEMNMLGVPPALSPVPPGAAGMRFPSNIGTPLNPTMFGNQAVSGRGVPPSLSGPGFNTAGPLGRGTMPYKTPGGWIPPRNGGRPGKAPSRGEQNDYSQNFVDTGMRPQSFIRELELTNVVEDYPKLRELIQKKDEIVAKSAFPPMYLKSDLREFELSPEFFGTKFDVILVDPPWEEYVHRAPGDADHMEYWTVEDILNLKIEAIADTPSFIFLWVGDGVGLEQDRLCLKKWGFRRCEDICWVKTNKSNATPGLRHDSHTLFQHSKEHCLMGIKGTVRRSTDGHIIHANIDTDVIIAEEPPYGSTRKPDDMYRIIEHFSLGRRRLELFGEDHNIRAGWLTMGKRLSSSNFNVESYTKSFADKDGKVWQGGGGRNPPPEAPHLLVTTPEIEGLRPKSPMKNQQQLQSASISLTTANSSNRRPTGNVENPSPFAINQEASSSNPSTPAYWAASPVEVFWGQESGNMHSDDKVFDMYGYGGPPANGDSISFDSQRPLF